MATKKALNATLAEVVPTLPDPMVYLLRVKAKIEQCKKAHGNAALRLGRRGTTQYPCFRIVFDEDGAERLFGAFMDSGRPVLPQDEASVLWSTSTTSYDEFREVLSALQIGKLPT